MKTEVSVKNSGGGGVLLTILLLAALAACGIFTAKYLKAKKEITTLEATKTALLNDTIKYYEGRTGQLVAKVEAVTLEKKELDKYNTSIRKDLKDMKIKYADAQEYISTQLVNNTKPPDMRLRDTVYIEKNKPVQAKHFNWSDAWGGMSGIIQNDSLKQPSYYSRDTITAVGTKVYKYKFLGLRFKLIGAELKVSNKNPHSVVNAPQMVKLE